MLIVTQFGHFVIDEKDVGNAYKVGWRMRKGESNGDTKQCKMVREKESMRVRECVES